MESLAQITPATFAGVSICLEGLSEVNYRLDISIRYIYFE